MVTVHGCHGYSAWLSWLQSMVVMVTERCCHGYRAWLSWLQFMVSMVTVHGCHGYSHSCGSAHPTVMYSLVINETSMFFCVRLLIAQEKCMSICFPSAAWRRNVKNEMNNCS